MHSQHGSGAVIVSSRKTGAVSVVVSGESGGAVRAPRNAGDRRVKRKRGSRSVAAIAARIERGYLKRTAGSTACVNNHVDFSGTGTHGSGHSAAECTSATARDGDDDTRTRKRKTRKCRACRTRQDSVQAGLVDTRVIGKPDQFDGDPMM